MANNIARSIVEHSKVHKRKNRWNKIVTGMAAVVVFCTTYALILPAITMEKEPLCGLEEHVHTEECYGIPMEISCNPEADIVIHTHNEFCYDSQGERICTLPEIQLHTHTDECLAPAGTGEPHVHWEDCYEEVYSCGQEESQGHTHAESCMGAQKSLSCTLEENHTHSDTCYETTLICRIPEGHVHSEECFEQKLICTEDHQHTAECYEAVLFCSVPENHVHSEDCFGSSCICGQAEGHIHGDDCYTEETCYVCGLEESSGHTHGPECIEKVLICGFEEAQEDAEGELICGQEEIVLHTHSSECYDDAGNLICGKMQVIEHNHTQDCMTPIPDAEPILICGREAHEHTDECRVDLEADLEEPADWESTLPGTTGDWCEDLLAMARSQLGYQESSLNYILTEDREAKGITRYGQWYGDPYGDWCAYFVAFCRHYAGIPAEAFPQHPGQPQWCEALKEENWGIYLPPDEYMPAPGDTVYFDLDGNGALDHVGLVEKWIPETEEESAKIQTIEGNSSNCVQQVLYSLDADEILGYASLANAKARWDLMNQPEEVPKIYYCGLEAHTHDPAACYGEDGTLTCTLAEHIHDETCETEPKTYYCGLEAHTHDPAACYGEDGTLTCALTEHIHDETCEIRPTYCGLAEHIHTEACMDPATGESICGLDEHTHTEACYTETISYCGLTEHTHGEGCYDASGSLICPLVEHTHDADCLLEFFCGSEEHIHSPTCSDENGNPICGREAHTHNETCRLKRQSLVADIYLDGTYTAADPENTTVIMVSGPMPRYVQVKAYPIKLAVEGQLVLAAYDISLFDIQGQIFQPEEPLKVTFQLPELMDVNEEDVNVAYVPERAKVSEEAPAMDEPVSEEKTEEASGEMDAIPMEEVEILDSTVVDDTITFDAGHFSEYAVLRSVTYSCPSDCKLDTYLTQWTDCTGTNPFGTAQEYNLFLLGNMDNWGVVHGNAAIMGNITRTSMGISYDEGSSQNYAADKTKHFPLGLVLGGNNGATSLVTVRNGTVISHVPNADNKEIDMDKGLDTDHLHVVQDLENDLLDQFFTNAQTKKNGDVGVNLIARNKLTFDYCEGLIGTGSPNLGRVDSLTDADCTEYKISTREPGDLIFEGKNDFFNVFNVKASQLQGVGETVTMRNIYLCVPYGSYTLINVEDDVVGKLMNFYPMFRYQDSNSAWIQQPAKHNMANYTQTQRTLMNFAPTITDVTTAKASGIYVYSSILAPQVSFHALDQTNLHGTIVLKNMDSNGKSAIIDNPFMIGSKLTMMKDTVCDDADGDTCPIHAQDKAENPWANYYADVTLKSTGDTPGEPIVATIPGLALNNNTQTIHGLTPGKYLVAEEEVYCMVNGKRIQIETFTGYWYTMDGTAKVYVDEDGKPFTSSTDRYVDPIFTTHSLNRATFGSFSNTEDGTVLNDGEKRILEVTPGKIGNLLITNHYEKEVTKRFTVQKLWMEHGYYIDENGHKWPYDFEVTPPAGAFVKIQLVRKATGQPPEDIPNHDDPGPGEIDGVIELSADNNWSYTWRDLPDHAPGNAYDFYDYTAKEIQGWDDFTVGEPHFDEDNQVLTCTNWRQQPPAGTMTVKKEWYDQNGKKLDCLAGDEDPCHGTDIHPANATVQLYKRTGKTKPKDNTVTYPALTVTMDGHLVSVNGGGDRANMFYVGSTLYVTVEYWYEGDRYTGGGDAQRPTFLVTNGSRVLNCTQSTNKSDSEYDYIYDESSHTSTYYQRSKLIFELHDQLSDTNIVITRNDQGEAEKPAFPVVYSELSDTSNNRVAIPDAGFHEEARESCTDWTAYTPVGESVGLNKSNGWSHAWPDESVEELVTRENGDQVQYFVFEEVPAGYKETYRVNGIHYPGAKPGDSPAKVPGMTEGTINIQNRPIPAGPELPDTGSIGTIPYTLGGLLAVIFAGSLMMYNHKKRRKEDTSP